MQSRCAADGANEQAAAAPAQAIDLLITIVADGGRNGMGKLPALAEIGGPIDQMVFAGLILKPSGKDAVAVRTLRRHGNHLCEYAGRAHALPCQRAII